MTQLNVRKTPRKIPNLFYCGLPQHQGERDEQALALHGHTLHGRQSPLVEGLQQIPGSHQRLRWVFRLPVNLRRRCYWNS